jgi:hypothetical protein
MQVSRIDYNLIAQIVEMKETLKGSVEAVMDEKITASHLATDVHRLLDLLDMMEQAWKGTPPEDGSMMAAQAPPAPTPPAEIAPAEAAPVEEVQVEQPPAEQPPVEGN